MPHKFYHGRTNRVWNDTKHVIGVEINMQHSRCIEEFRLRKVKNDDLKAEAKAKGAVIYTKRQSKGPKPGFIVEGVLVETGTLVPYNVINDLKGGY
uniref:Uncharacterized protein n=1 Tax=Cucumis sativus TaxID=3659 RepID=A0A0A0KQY9_CUCSA